MAIEGGGKHRRELPETEVRMDEFKVGRGILRTEGLNTCIGVALNDAASKTGAMGHLPDHSRGEVRTLVGEFLEGAGANPENVKAYLRGGVVSYALGEVTADDMREYAEHQRTEAVEGLRASGIMTEKTDISWLTENRKSVAMELNTETGRFTSIEEDNPEEMY